MGACAVGGFVKTDLWMPGRWSLVLIICVNGCCNYECQCGVMHRES
jgi:hypothetical protein